MSDEKTSHIMFVKEQVLRFAAAKNHTHLVEDITDLMNIFAPKNHQSDSDEYGKGNTTKYGHLKLNTSIENADDNTMPVSVSGIVEYITNQINALKNELTDIYQSKINIIDSTKKLESYKDEDKTDDKYNIPTSKAVWEALENYEGLLDGVSLSRPQSVNKDIDQLREPGYYLQTGNRHFSYGGESINYKNALIKVERQKNSNRVIQHVYATSKITTSDGPVYKINGSEYTRWGTSSTDWKAWHVAHKPYTKTVRACKWGAGVDKGSVVVYENTAGFIIHWDQTKQADDRYPVSAKLYEYATVCEFEPPLPIKGPYVFGNLIGRCDFRITSNKMEIRSNVSPGGRIIGMHETFFVPRNQ